MKYDFKISDVYNKASVVYKADDYNKDYICQDAENIKDHQFLYSEQIEHDEVRNMCAQTGCQSYGKN
ncbi:hypothetical protein [Ruminococcus sp.]|uniref:hypothetical protein n=1 Tax=Ruminococcus sp. TaxID=41978 RepID=UPI001B42B892|nr:hypothetical protein [Ruminococcus sp.]MBP5434125.1 hypothetical protein [Ruminococcus sp.]